MDQLLQEVRSTREMIEKLTKPMTLQETAEFLNVGKKHKIYELQHRPGFPVKRLGGRTLRVFPMALMAWLMQTEDAEYEPTLIKAK